MLAATLLPLLGALIAQPPAQANALATPTKRAVDVRKRSGNSTVVNRSGTLLFYDLQGCHQLHSLYNIKSPDFVQLDAFSSIWMDYVPIDSKGSFCDVQLYSGGCGDPGDVKELFFLPGIENVCTTLKGVYKCAEMVCFLEDPDPFA